MVRNKYLFQGLIHNMMNIDCNIFVFYYKLNVIMVIEHVVQKVLKIILQSYYARIKGHYVIS